MRRQKKRKRVKRGNGKYLISVLNIIGMGRREKGDMGVHKAAHFCLGSTEEGHGRAVGRV